MIKLILLVCFLFVYSSFAVAKGLWMQTRVVLAGAQGLGQMAFWKVSGIAAFIVMVVISDKYRYYSTGLFFAACPAILFLLHLASKKRIR